MVTFGTQRARRSRTAELLALIAISTILSFDAPHAGASPASPCVGDCSGDGAVTVDELVRGIAVALGNQSVGNCPVFDPSADGFVTVDEIVRAVSNALDGCPIVPTPTVTATAEPSPTPSATATAGPPPPVSVLIATGMRIYNLSTIVTSLGTPILGPTAEVIDLVEVTTGGTQVIQVLLKLVHGEGFPIVLGQGQLIPNSTATIGSIGQTNAKPAGTFAFVDAPTGASLLRRSGESDPIALLGLGAPAERAGFESRSFVVPSAGGVLVSDAFAPGENRALVAVDLDSTTAPLRLVTQGDTVNYRNDAGDSIEATVTDIGAIFAGDDVATAALVLDDAKPALATFSFTDTTLLERLIAFVAGNQAPGFNPGAKLEEFDGGLRFGGTADDRMHGFATFLSGTEFPGFSESAVYITDGELVPLAIVQAGAPVPDFPQATIDAPRAPVMGVHGAAVRYTLVNDDSERAAIGLVDYQTQTFRTLVVTGDSLPGGVLTNLPASFALNVNDDLVFRGDFGSGQSAYYALNTATVGASPRRLVGTGDTVILPEGGSAMITALASIPSTGGLGGEATAVGPTHFTVGATLDGDTGAILSVEIVE